MFIRNFKMQNSKACEEVPCMMADIMLAIHKTLSNTTSCALPYVAYLAAALLNRQRLYGCGVFYDVTMESWIIVH